MNNNTRLALFLLLFNVTKCTLCKQAKYLSRLEGSSLQLISSTFKASRVDLETRSRLACRWDSELHEICHWPVAVP